MNFESKVHFKVASSLPINPFPKPNIMVCRSDFLCSRDGCDDVLVILGLNDTVAVVFSYIYVCEQPWRRPA